MVAGVSRALVAPFAGGAPRPEGNNSKQEMGAQFFSPLLEGITSTPPTVEYPQLYSSWSRCKDGGSRVASLHDCTNRRAQINLSYSASDPDMFGLVTSILQEPTEQEPITDWDSLSRCFPPLWTLDLEKSSGCSRLFPTKVLDKENLANIVDAWSPYEGNLRKASSTELLNSKLSDLDVTRSGPASSHPRCLSSDDVLKTSDLEGKVFTCNGLRQQPSFAPECSYDKKLVNIGKGGFSSSQPKITNGAVFKEECQKTNPAGGVLGVSHVEESNSYFMQLPNSAADRIWDPEIQENHLYAKGYTHDSPVPYLLNPTFEQGNSIPEELNRKRDKNYQQSCLDNVGIMFDSNEGKPPAYSSPDSSNNLSLNPGRQPKNSPYSGDRCLESKAVNPVTPSCVTYRKQKRINSLSRGSSANHSVGRPFCSQMSSRKGEALLVAPNVYSHLGFSHGKENLKPRHSVGCSRGCLRAPAQQYAGEVLTNVSSGGFSRPQSAKGYRVDRPANGGHAGERTGQEERWRKTPCHGIPPPAASVGPDWAQLDAWRRKPNEANLSNFINPSFLPLFPLVPGYSKLPNFPAFHLPPLSPSSHVAFRLVPWSEWADLHRDDFPHLSPFNNDLFCRDVATPTVAFSPRLNPHRSRNRGRPAHELHVHLEECHEQWRALESERKKIETDLATRFPGKPLSSSNNLPFSRLPAKPSRVDRLILHQFREQARVCALLAKMERLCGIPIHRHISASLGRHLEAIYATQARRKDEMVNAGNPQRKRTTWATHEKDVLALSAAVKELASFTRKTRTALWCAFQMTLPKISASPPVPEEELQKALSELGPASVLLQTKIVEGEA